MKRRRGDGNFSPTGSFPNELALALIHLLQVGFGLSDEEKNLCHAHNKRKIGGQYEYTQYGYAKGSRYCDDFFGHAQFKLSIGDQLVKAENLVYRAHQLIRIDDNILGVKLVRHVVLQLNGKQTHSERPIDEYVIERHDGHIDHIQPTRRETKRPIPVENILIEKFPHQTNTLLPN